VSSDAGQRPAQLRRCHNDGARDYVVATTTHTDYVVATTTSLPGPARGLATGFRGC